MSEVLRELVVALSLDSDNFSRNMRTINQQIKEAESNIGHLSSISGLGRSPGEGNGYPLQYSGLENSMDRGTRSEEHTSELQSRI